ncbi:hypothetical protein Rin_00014160, partial [Candidatus Regiella insecticola 5.15]
NGPFRQNPGRPSDWLGLLNLAPVSRWSVGGSMLALATA